MTGVIMALVKQQTSIVSHLSCDRIRCLMTVDQVTDTDVFVAVCQVTGLVMKLDQGTNKSAGDRQELAGRSAPRVGCGWVVGQCTCLLYHMYGASYHHHHAGLWVVGQCTCLLYHMYGASYHHHHAGLWVVGQCTCLLYHMYNTSLYHQHAGLWVVGQCTCLLYHMYNTSLYHQHAGLWVGGGSVYLFPIPHV